MIDLKTNVNTGHPSANKPAQPHPAVAYVPPDLAKTTPVSWPMAAPALNLWYGLPVEARELIHHYVVAHVKNSHRAAMEDLVRRLLSVPPGVDVEAVINEWGSE